LELERKGGDWIGLDQMLYSNEGRQN